MIRVAQPMQIWSESAMYRAILDMDEWIAEPKHDGWRALARTTGNGVELTTKNGQPIPHDIDLSPIKAPPGTVFDGEWMRKRKELILWDVPLFAGGALVKPLEERWLVLLSSVPRLGKVRATQRLAKRTALRTALVADMEGIVFKRRGSYYPHGKTTDWIKVKG